MIRPDESVPEFVARLRKLAVNRFPRLPYEAPPFSYSPAESAAALYETAHVPPPIRTYVLVIRETTYASTFREYREAVRAFTAQDARARFRCLIYRSGQPAQELIDVEPFDSDRELHRDLPLRS